MRTQPFAYPPERSANGGGLWPIVFRSVFWITAFAVVIGSYALVA